MQDKFTLLLGDEGARPSIRFYDTRTGIKTNTLTKGLIKGVECITVSPNGRLLAALCMDESKTVVIYDSEEAWEPTLIQQSNQAGAVELCW